MPNGNSRSLIISSIKYKEVRRKSEVNFHTEAAAIYKRGGVACKNAFVRWPAAFDRKHVGNDGEKRASSTLIKRFLASHRSNLNST